MGNDDTTCIVKQTTSKQNGYLSIVWKQINLKELDKVITI